MDRRGFSFLQITLQQGRGNFCASRKGETTFLLKSNYKRV
nr:MAG TPA: hypothetical protein [Bacteriophage sp.]